MAIIGMTHEYGPWSPVRFLLLPSLVRGADPEAPTFYVTTTRMCRGIHDWRCTAVETQTFGPLILAGRTRGDLYRCDNCGRIQPPPDVVTMDQKAQCLFCADTVQHAAEDLDSTAAVTAVAALSAASGILRQTKEADPDGYLALLDDTGDELRSVLDDASWAVRQDPRRAAQTGYGHLTLIARQIVANARGYAELHTENHPVDSPAVPEGTE